MSIAIVVRNCFRTGDIVFHSKANLIQLGPIQPIRFWIISDVSTSYPSLYCLQCHFYPLLLAFLVHSNDGCSSFHNSPENVM